MLTTLCNKIVKKNRIQSYPIKPFWLQTALDCSRSLGDMVKWTWGYSREIANMEQLNLT